MTTIKITLTEREEALLALCMSDLTQRQDAVEACRNAFGRHLAVIYSERANVAAVLASNGYDGIGRVALAMSDLQAAARRAANFRHHDGDKVSDALGKANKHDLPRGYDRSDWNA